MNEAKNAAPTGDTAAPDDAKTVKTETKDPVPAAPAETVRDPAGNDGSGEGEGGSLEGFASENADDDSNGSEGGGDGVVKGALEEEDEDPGESAEETGGKSDDDVELYKLNFEDADPEGLKALSKIGKEFNIPTEKAQELADAATKYGASLLKQQQEQTKRGYSDFRAGLKSELKERWGADYSANIREAKRGAAVLVRKYGFPKDFDRQDQYAHLSDDVRFLNVLRDLHRFNSETPHIQGDSKSMGGGDEFSYL